MSTRKLKYPLIDAEKDVGPLTFSGLLSSYRIINELTHTEMAEKLGISKQSLHDLETGKRVPTPSRAEFIAEKLDKSPEVYIEVAMRDYLRSFGWEGTINIKEKIL